MLKLLRNKKGQNTAEYAILIALVVGGVIAMQTYAQRTMQARLRDASRMMTTSTSDIGNTEQYEPYYSNTVSDNDKIAKKVDSYAGQVSNTVTSKKQGTYQDTSVYLGNQGY